MPFNRQIMYFIVPTSVLGIKTNDGANRKAIPLYINPESFQVTETKLINKTRTKGGFAIQYWGEELPKISASGSTGSGGIEAVNILRNVYRHEQIQFSKLLLERARAFADEANAALGDTTNSSVVEGIVSIVDEILDGSISSIREGTESAIDVIKDSILPTDSGLRNTVELIPTLSSFAVSIDIYFQGEKFRGYFTDFRVDESGQTPGLFNYSFGFEVLKRSGRRKNFMPWHRNPRDLVGVPRPASVPIEGAREDELSFPTDSTQANITGKITTTFRETQESPTEDINNIGVSRLSKVKS